MKNYLITGGCGFIGSNFIKYILKKYKDIRVLNIDKLTYAGNLENLKGIENNPNYEFFKIDICDKYALKNIFKNNDIHYVINFAAESHVDRSIKNPEVFVETNILGTVNLLNAAKEQWQNNDNFFKGRKFLQISTDEVYGSLGTTGYFTEKTPLDPHSPYSSSKASADLMVKAYYDTYKLPINITRCSNNYGPYQFPEKLIPLIINNCINKKEIPIYGDGLNIRDWLYVKDHCSALDIVLHKSKTGEIYNIGGHNEKTNLFIVNMILQYIKNNVNPMISKDLLKFVEDRKGHDKRYGIDPAKISKELNWNPEVKFETGIIKTIEWYLKNKEWLHHVTSGEYENYYKKMYQ